MPRESFELDNVILDAETELALLVRDCDVDVEDAVEDEDKWWIPRSQIYGTDLERIGDVGYVELPMWFAEKSGMA